MRVAGLGTGVIALVNSGPEGDEATDYDATMFVRHIGRPAGNNADDYVRAAFEEPRQRDVTVLEATTPPATSVDDDLRASLLFQINHAPGEAAFTLRGHVSACYRADFNRHGVMNDGPKRVDCPEHAIPVTPPPMPHRVFPHTYADAMKKILSELPATTSADEVLATLRAKLPPPPTNPFTRAPGTVPGVEVKLRNGAIGLAAVARSDQFGQQWAECVYAARRADGTATVWWGNAEPRRAGTVECTPEHALEV